MAEAARGPAHNILSQNIMTGTLCCDFLLARKSVQVVESLICMYVLLRLAIGLLGLSESISTSHRALIAMSDQNKLHGTRFV